MGDGVRGAVWLVLVLVSSCAEPPPAPALAPPPVAATTGPSMPAPVPPCPELDDAALDGLRHLVVHPAYLVFSSPGGGHDVWPMATLEHELAERIAAGAAGTVVRVVPGGDASGALVAQVVTRARAVGIADVLACAPAERWRRDSDDAIVPTVPVARPAASSRPAPAPAGTTDARGSLSREVIRGVIRSHIDEVRVCYERSLALRPEIAGRVTVAFIISPSGAVSSANVATSTLGDAQVETCIVAAVRTWAFPPPEGGGIVGVNYPFVLESVE